VVPWPFVVEAAAKKERGAGGADAGRGPTEGEAGLARPAPGSPAAGSWLGAAALPWVASTYFAEGLPYSIVHQISAQLFTALGASLPAIGLTALYGLAWNVKFLWGPVVDRSGSGRSWIVGTELALGALVALIAVPAELGDLAVVARALVVVAVLAALHDVAIDGFYLRALGKGEQAALSGPRVAAYRGALLVGNGALVALAGRTSWLLCFLAAGGLLLLLGLGHGLLLPRREAASPGGPAQDLAAAGPARGRLRGDFRLALASFLEQPRVVPTLAFVLVYRAGDALMFAMSTPLLKELGLGTAERGVLGGLGTAASILGSMIGGAVIARIGLGRTLRPIALVQSLAIPLYAWLAWARPGLAAIRAVVVAEQLAAGVGTAAFVVFLMRRCSGAYKASHFALLSALMSLATTLAGSGSGYLAQRIGFAAFFLVAFAASLPGVALARRVPTE
jgi:PAT family beta-lactamase induction signal transducer AmpG